MYEFFDNLENLSEWTESVYPLFVTLSCFTKEIKTMKRIIIAVVLLSTLVTASEIHRHFHIHQISLTEFAVSCDNGGDPTGKKDSNVLIISCGK